MSYTTEVIQEVERENPEVIRLAEAVSLAILVDSALLRQTRLDLVPEADAGTEADLWFSPLVQSAGPDGMVFAPEISEALRFRLAADQERLQRAWKITESMHRHLSPAIRLEEEIAWLSASSCLDSMNRIEDLLRSALAAMVDGKRKGLAHWAARALSVLPSGVRTHAAETVRMLNTGAYLRLDDRRMLPIEGERIPDWMPWVVPDLPRVPVRVRLFENAVELDSSNPKERNILYLPETDPLLLELSWRDLGNDVTKVTHVIFRKGEVVRTFVPVWDINIRTITGDLHNLREVRERPNVFDVFLSHNSKDKPAVRQIAEALRDRGVRVWLDEWELIPGRPWQEALEEIIQTTRAAAVLVGRDGLGPWENPEMRACLSEFVDRTMPVIPVLLPDVPRKPELPLFLRHNTWIDLRRGLSPEGIERLVWGITGEKPRPGTGPRWPGPRLHNLPVLSIEGLFKGRDADLAALAANLAGPNTATAIVQPQAIHGLGGIGKTRLAVEYAWRFGNRYQAAFFVRADSSEILRAGLASLASSGLLGLPEAMEEEAAVNSVLMWLRQNSGWLLILDNVDTEEAEQAVLKILPSLEVGHVLITSRRVNWPAGIVEQPIDKLALEEATHFLLESTSKGRPASPNDLKQAAELAKLLDGLPLALEQAAAYINHRRIRFSDYLKDWQRKREAVLSWYDSSLMRYPAPVAVTWQNTFDQLLPTAKTILRLTTWLASAPLPVELFEKGADIIAEGSTLLNVEAGEAAPVESVSDALGDLAAYSLMFFSQGMGTVHQLVLEVLRIRIPEEQRRSWLELSVQLIARYSPPDPEDVRTWPIWDLLYPHAAKLVSHADYAGILEPTSKLMSQLGLLLYTKGLYAAAEPLMRRALSIDQEALGEQHPNVARDLSNLARLLQATNRLAEAEPLMRRALDIDQNILGENHPNFAISLNNLAQLLQATNRLAEAEPLMRHALDIDQNAFGENHPNVAISLNNLAQLLQKTNRLAEAEPLMRRAFDIDQNAFGENHPNVARDLNNLAQLLQATNRASEAEPLMRRAFELFSRSLGPDHPRTKIAYQNLATLLREESKEDSSS